MKKRNIILGILAILIVIVISIGITTAFMKPIEEVGNLTEIALSSCAKIKLTGESSVNLSNTYPMSRNRGLQTTPYRFTVTSYCKSPVGFSLYVAPLSSNTLDTSNIHYIVTERDLKVPLAEGILSKANSATDEFSSVEINELQTGLKSSYSDIFTIYGENIPLKGSREYDLYLFVDGDATNETMGQTFKAGVAIKAYDRNADNSLSNYILNQYKNNKEYSEIYYHGSSLDKGAKDNSYRYAGANPNNYICFGSNEETCPLDNLYRIVGVFGKETHGINANLVKVVKYDLANSSLLGTDGGFAEEVTDYEYPLGTSFTNYVWNSVNDSNAYSDSELVNTNLNVNFKNNIGYSWSSTMPYINWNIGQVPLETFDNYPIDEISLIEIETSKRSPGNQIGLLNLSDYKYAGGDGYFSEGEFWFTDNWLHMENVLEYTFTTLDEGTGFFYASRGGKPEVNGAETTPVRPSFYLDKDIIYARGDGSIDNPIRIVESTDIVILHKVDAINAGDWLIQDVLQIDSSEYPTCYTSDGSAVNVTSDLANLTEDIIYITCISTENKKINKYIMLDNLDNIHETFDDFNTKFDGNFYNLCMIPKGGEINCDMLLGRSDNRTVDEFESLQSIIEAINENNYHIIYIPYMTEINRLKLSELLKENNLSNVSIISNSYFISKNMLMSDYVKDLQF